jgi:hypothetical protein
MKVACAVVVLVAGVFAAGCASTDGANSEPEEREYATGSNIPKRTRPNSDVKVYTPTATDLGNRPQNLPTSRGAP